MDIEMTFKGKPIGKMQSATINGVQRFPDVKHIVKDIADGEVTIGTFWGDRLVSTATYLSDGTHLGRGLEVGTEVDIANEMKEDN